MSRLIETIKNPEGSVFPSIVFGGIRNAALFVNDSDDTALHDRVKKSGLIPSSNELEVLKFGRIVVSIACRPLITTMKDTLCRDPQW
jgi:hypothetical protein